MEEKLQMIIKSMFWKIKDERGGNCPEFGDKNGNCDGCDFQKECYDFKMVKK